MNLPFEVGESKRQPILHCIKAIIRYFPNCQTSTSTQTGIRMLVIYKQMKKRNNHILIRHLDNRLQYSSMEYSWHWCKVKESLGKEEEAIWVGRKKVGKRRKKRRDQQEPLYAGGIFLWTRCRWGSKQAPPGVGASSWEKMTRKHVRSSLTLEQWKYKNYPILHGGNETQAFIK